MAVSEKLQASLKSLHLSTMLAELERFQEDPAARNLDFEGKLEHLVTHELTTRETRAVANRIRAALFKEHYRLEDYDFERMPNLDKKLIVDLHGCDWIPRGDNLIFSGGHGLGKTHLAISIGLEACEKRYRVLFTKADQLVLKLLEAREEARVLSLRAKLQRVDLLVIDELGYTPFDRR